MILIYRTHVNNLGDRTPKSQMRSPASQRLIIATSIREIVKILLSS
ncbi:hypothetical protein [Calothrix sp. NIES-2098]